MFYSHLSFCPQWAMYHPSPPTMLLASGQYTFYCNTVLFKLGQNHEMYSWVVQFLNYFISISERDIERGSQRQRGDSKDFIYLFFFVNNFCKWFFVDLNSFLHSFFYHHHY